MVNISRKIDLERCAFYLDLHKKLSLDEQIPDFEVHCINCEGIKNKICYVSLDYLIKYYESGGNL